MSEKHGQLGAQWTKSAAPAAQASTPVPLPVPVPVPVPGPLQKPSVNPYGNCGLQPADISYSAARFQAPVIHAKASPLTITPVGSGIAGGGSIPPSSQISPTSHTHVPVPVPPPSGFIPPPFPNAVAAPVGATSVLTPNPFATTAGNAAGLAFANASFPYNTAQLGLGKIMHAISGAPAGSVPVAGTAAPTTGGPAAPTIPGQRHPSEGVSATSGVINSTIAENVMNALTNSNSTGGGPSVPSEEKMRRVQQVIESSLE